MADDIFTKDEVLSDNTRANYCEQCKDCTFWGMGDDPFQNRYDKGNCAMYPNPGHKPGYVINNQGPCEFRAPNPASLCLRRSSSARAARKSLPA